MNTLTDSSLFTMLIDECRDRSVLIQIFCCDDHLIVNTTVDCSGTTTVISDTSSVTTDVAVTSTQVFISTTLEALDPISAVPASIEIIAVSSVIPDVSSALPASSEIILVTSVIPEISPTTVTSASHVIPTSSPVVSTSSTVDLASSFATSTIQSQVSGTMCSCQCPNDLLSTPLDSSQIEQMTSSIQKELYVNEREVSASKRKYISVNDQRPSAQTVGYFGVCIVAVTFSGIVLMDISSLAKDIMELVNACKRED
ncbi:hypothetical protein RRG08_039715 [Elysia crispata]|uniref:Uncharacterized protein n=1 Tax=Elysia crispata TaxID=231223 RepID=A0AAE1CVA0_9GAST|nr:hypothetical protein RRG08_039715 [Elysia crispata]